MELHHFRVSVPLLRRSLESEDMFEEDSKTYEKGEEMNEKGCLLSSCCKRRELVSEQARLSGT